MGRHSPTALTRLQNETADSADTPRVSSPKHASTPAYRRGGYRTAPRHAVVALQSTLRVGALAVIAVGIAIPAIASPVRALFTPASAASPTYKAIRDVSDKFDRTVRRGFGAADMGGTYAVSSRTAQFSVRPGSGHIGPISSGQSMRATLRSLHQADQRMQATLKIGALPRGGSGSYVGFDLRRQTDGSAYRMRARIWPNGHLTLGFTRVRKGVSTTLDIGAPKVHSVLAANHRLVVSAQVLGKSPVILQMSAWLDGAATPAWQATYADHSAARLSDPGAAGLWSYTSASTRPVTLTVQNLQGWRLVPADSGPSSSPTASSAPPTDVPSTPTPTSSGSTSPESSSVDSTTPATSTPASTPASTTDTTSATSPAPSSSASTSSGAATPSPTSSSASPSPTESSSSPPDQVPPGGGASDDVGAAALGSTNYAIPRGALFVSPSGSNAGTGSIDAPYASVAKAISAASSGGTIVLRAGSYHENVTIPTSKVLTIQAYPGEVAWFDGSVPVTSWAKSGSAWVHTGWTAQFDSTSSFTSSSMSQWIAPGYPMAGHPDQAWIDGTELKQVGSLSEVTAGTFYVDYSDQSLYVGSDPNGHSVRASDLGGVGITVGSPGSVLRGFGVRGYATSVSALGTVMLSGAADHIENLVVSDNATRGVYARVSDVTMDHVTAEGNGLLGIAGHHADGLRITNTLAQNNNTEHFNDSPVSGGIKISGSRDVSVRGTVARNNQGNGLWFDESCFNFVVTGGVYQGNTHFGMIAEISSTGIITDNVIDGNGDSGVRITDSDMVKIWNNTFSNNDKSISLYQDSRTYTSGAAGVDTRYYPDSAMTWTTRHIDIENNLMTHLAQFHVYVYDSTHSTPASQRDITVDGDLFSTPGSGQAEIGWYAGAGTVTSFKSIGAFENSTGGGKHNTERSDASGTWNAQVVQSTGDPLPLPSDVAAAAGQPSGTRHIGTF